MCRCKDNFHCMIVTTVNKLAISQITLCCFHCYVTQQHRVQPFAIKFLISISANRSSDLLPARESNSHLLPKRILKFIQWHNTETQNILTDYKSASTKMAESNTVDIFYGMAAEALCPEFPETSLLFHIRPTQQRLTILAIVPTSGQRLCAAIAPVTCIASLPGRCSSPLYCIQPI